jgi:hypothetical protein
MAFWSGTLILSLFCAAFVNTEAGVEVVVAHFNEDLHWLAKLAQKEAKDVLISVYSKGSDIVPDLPVEVKAERLPNVGRESHTYLSHIVKNYDQLSDWTVFTQAGEPSFGYKGHREGGGHLLAGDDFTNYLVPDASGSRFIFTSAVHLPSMNHVMRATFCINDHSLEKQSVISTCPDQSLLWTKWLDMDMFKDFIDFKIRSQQGKQPLDYYRTYINPEHRGSELVIPFTQGARFAVAREKILRHPKVHYERLLATLSHHADPYSGYFMEWLWSELFLGHNVECKVPQLSSPVSQAEAIKELIGKSHLFRSLAISGISNKYGSTNVGSTNDGDSSNASTSTTSKGGSTPATEISVTSNISEVNSTTVMTSTAQPTSLTAHSAVAVGGGSINDSNSNVSTSSTTQGSSTAQGVSTTQGSSTSQAAATSSQTTSVAPSTSTSSGAGTSQTGTATTAAPTKISGKVTLSIPCSFIQEGNANDAIKQGLRSSFIDSATANAGAYIEVALECATGSTRRLAGRQMSTESVVAKYSIYIPQAATSVNMLNLQRKVAAVTPSALSTSINGAMSNYQFTQSYSVAVTAISAPTLDLPAELTSTTATGTAKLAIRTASSNSVSINSFFVILTSVAFAVMNAR